MKVAANFTRLVWLLLLGCLLTGCKRPFHWIRRTIPKWWQGTWKMVATTYDGAPQPGDMAWIVAGDRDTIRLDGQAHVDPYMIKLDTGRKRIDVFHHETPPGTYGGKLEGNLQDQRRFPDRVLRSDRPTIPEILRCRPRFAAGPLRVPAGVTLGT